MKITGIILLALAVSIVDLRGQTADQYTFAAFSTGMYQPLTGAAPLLSGQSQLSVAVPIGFDFVYEGNVYNTFRVSTDGYVVLGSGTIPQGMGNDLSTPFLSPIIAPLWDALLFSQTGAMISYQTSGPAFNRVLVVQFASGQFANPGFPATGEGEINMQVRFYEADGVIEFVYGFILPTSSFQPSASIGINGDSNGFLSVAQDFQNVSNTISYNDLNVFPSAGTLFRFTPPDGDFTPPVLSNFSLSPSTTQCQPVARVATVRATDDLSGVTQLWFVRLYNGVEQTPIAFSLTSGNPNDGVWTANIPPAPSGQTVYYYLNAFDAFGNAVMQAFAGAFVDFQPSLSAGPNQTVNAGTSATLVADAPAVLPLRLTEIILDPDGEGGGGLPPYVPPTAKNLVELTNLGNVPVPLAGVSLVVQGEGARTFNLPSVTLAPGTTMLIRIGTGVDSPPDRYYHTGGSNDPLYIESYVGFYLVKSNTVIDAVGITYYDFEAPVTNAHWSGFLYSTGAAGFVRRYADSNGASDWTPASAGAPISPNVPNPGLNALPNLSLVWSPGNLDGFTVTTPPLTTTTTFTATLTYGGCTVSSTVTVTVANPQTPQCDFTVLGGQYHTTQSVVCFQDLTTGGIPDTWLWTFQPPSVEFVSGQFTANPCVRFLSDGVYTVSLTVSNSAGADTETKTDYVFVALDYCAPQYLFESAVDYIARVRLATMDNVTGDEPGEYTLFTLYNPELSRGQSYELTVTNGPTANEYVGAWIDFNRNGVFDANERLGEVHLTAAGQSQTMTFVVPADAVLGANRMRVRMAYQESGVTPCGLHQYGETEDYFVLIVAAGCETPPVGGTATGPSSVPAFGTVNYQLAGHTGNIQWQYSLDGINWVNIPGAVSSTLSIQWQYDNQSVRVRAMLVSPGCDPAYSNVVVTQVLPLLGNSASFPFDITDFPYFDEQNTAQFTATLPGQTAPDVFYRFSTPNCFEMLRISTCDASFDARLYVLNANLEVVAQAENNCGSLGAHLELTGLTPGAMYFIVVSGVDGQFGNYTVSVFVDYGSGGLTVNGGPDVSIPCGGETVLTATVEGGSGQYLVQWDAGWIEGPQLMVNAAGVYVVRAYDVGGEGCMATDTVVVSLVGSDFNVSVQPNQVYLCDGQSMTLTAVVGGASGAYSCQWSNGETGTQIVVSAAGVYSCQCVDSAGCTAVGTSQLVFAPSPAVDLGPHSQACVGSTITLDAGNPGSAYVWSTGGSSRTVTLALDQIGTVVVSVTVVNFYGCVGMGSVEIEVTDSPQSQLPPSLTVCVGETVTLLPGITGAEYVWNDGSTQPFYVFAAQTPGVSEVSVEISAGTGCFVRDSVTITVLPAPEPDLGPDRSLCSGETVVLNSGVPEASYLWSTGEVSQTISVGQAGTYWVEVRLGECSSRDTVVLTTPPAPNILTILPDTLLIGQTFTAQAVGSAGAFNWTFGLSATPQTAAGQTVNNVSFSDPGVKIVRLVVRKDGCDFVFNDTIFVKDTVSALGERESWMFSVRPNPTRDYVEFFLPPYVSTWTIELLDPAGKIVFRSRDERILDVSALPGGVYLLRVGDGRRMYFGKISVVK
jgi:PKD repeat protein